MFIVSAGEKKSLVCVLVLFSWCVLSDTHTTFTHPSARIHIHTHSVGTGGSDTTVEKGGRKRRIEGREYSDGNYVLVENELLSEASRDENS